VVSSRGGLDWGVGMLYYASEKLLQAEPKHVLLVQASQLLGKSFFIHRAAYANVSVSPLRTGATLETFKQILPITRVIRSVIYLRCQHHWTSRPFFE